MENEQFQTVNVPELNYQQTTNPDKILYINPEEFDSSIWLVLVKKDGNIRKRAIAGVSYNGFDGGKVGGTEELPQPFKRKLDQKLEDILCIFGNLGTLGPETAEKLEYEDEFWKYVDGLPTELEAPHKIISHVVMPPNGASNHNGNKVFNYIVARLNGKGIKPALDLKSNSRNENNPDDKQTYLIDAKEVAVHHLKVNIVYRASSGTWLNTKSFFNPYPN